LGVPDEWFGYGLNDDFFAVIVDCAVVLVDAASIRVKDVGTLGGKPRPRILHRSIVTKKLTE
jgi:hypothetical protein